MSNHVAPSTPGRSGSQPTNSATMHFSTGGLRPDQQFAAWRDEMNSLIEVSLPDGVRPADGYKAEMTLFNLGKMVLSSEKFDAMDYELTTSAMRRGNVDHWVLSLNKCGFAKTRVGDFVSENIPGRLNSRALTRPFKGAASAVEMIFVYLPRDLFPELAGTLDALGARAFEDRLSGLLADFLLLTETRLPTLSDEEMPVAASAVETMISTCLAPTKDKLFSAREQLELTMRQRIRSYIRHNLLSSELSPNDICRKFQVSRSQLYRIFNGEGGIAREIRYQRLMAAHSALSDANNRRAVYDIALEFGFTSGDEFGRTFRAEFGYSPTEARSVSRKSILRSTSANSFGDLMQNLGR
ncbi:helix-turn-helix domain-containing protein [Rhizobium leguminosarum bv. viciae]|nr:helix-turn-helix domain-containing protein [Rhizobium leguminosarum bv. viciae]